MSSRATAMTVPNRPDEIFPPAGAQPYKRDMKTLDYHLIAAGHCALETDGDTIATLMREFLRKDVAKNDRRRGDPR